MELTRQTVRVAAQPDDTPAKLQQFQQRMQAWWEQNNLDKAYNYNWKHYNPRSKATPPSAVMRQLGKWEFDDDDSVEDFDDPTYDAPEWDGSPESVQLHPKASELIYHQIQQIGDEVGLTPEQVSQIQEGFDLSESDNGAERAVNTLLYDTAIYLDY
jgi:hypothetical protein